MKIPCKVATAVIQNPVLNGMASIALRNEYYLATTKETLQGCRQHDGKWDESVAKDQGIAPTAQANRDHLAK